MAEREHREGIVTLEKGRDTLRLLDASEICFGLILQKKIDVEHVNPTVFSPPYGEAIKLMKTGAEISDLYDKVGLAPIRSAIEAGNVVDEGNPYDFLEVLQQAYGRETLASVLEREMNKLRKGGDADLLAIESAVERNVDMANRYTSLYDIAPSTGIWVPTGYKPFDEHIGGIPDANLTIIGAPPGCLTGDTLVGVNREGKSFKISMRELEHMVHGGKRGGRAWDKNIPTQIRSRFEDGTIRLSNIRSVLCSGVKEVYRLELHNGMSVIGTTDHPVYTKQGWKHLGSLTENDEVWVESPTQKKKNTSPKIQYREHEGLKHHPFAHTHSAHKHSVARHILVMEADMNGVDLDKWIDMGRNGYDHSGYLFVSRDYHVHHKDGNSLNNDISNLELMTEKDHHLLHSEHNWRNVNYYTVLSGVKSVTPRGKQETFDIEIDGEPHNFLANGIVVHNTGKTSLLVKLITSMARQNKKVLFYTLEMTGGQISQRVIEIESDTQHETYKKNVTISSDILNVDEICTEASRVVATDDYGMIAIDFADLMLSEKEEEGNVAHMYRSVARLAKKSGVATVLLSQLNRSYAEHGGIPRIHNIRWSGLAEAMAALILLIYNPNQIYGAPPTKGSSLIAHPGRGYVIVGKSRFGYKHGTVGAIDIEWDGRSAWGDEAMGWMPLSSV